MMKKPLLIVFEGVDRSGKSSIIDSLFREKQIYNDIGPISRYAEPSRQIKDVIVNKEKLQNFLGFLPGQDELDITNYFIIMAGRVSAVDTYYKLLSRGYNVFLDRCFISSMVYQKNATKFVNILEMNKRIMDYYNNTYLAENPKIDLLVLVNSDYKTYVQRSRLTGEHKYILPEHKFLELQNDYYFVYDNCESFVENKIMITNDNLEESTNRIYERIVKLSN